MYAAAAKSFRPDPTNIGGLHPQQQLADGKKLFGPHAKLKLQNSPPVSLQDHCSNFEGPVDISKQNVSGAETG